MRNRATGCRRVAAIVMLAALTLAGAGTQAAQAADFVVDSTADAADVRPGDRLCRTATATCTLRAAFQEANATTGADAVVVGPGHYGLTSVPSPEAGFPLESDAGNGDLDITDTLTVRGAGARQTTVDGGGLDRVFSIRTSTTALISDMTITGGDATGGGTARGIGMGGGVFNQGTATLERLRLVANAADGGGAVFNTPRTYVTIRDSLLAGNRAVEGGAIRFDSGGEVVNSTITGNVLQMRDLAALLPDEMSGYGGGIDHRGGNDVAIVSSTITNNHAIKGGGGLNSGQGYAPVSPEIALGRVRLRNSIVAGNTSEAGPANCHVSAQIIESTGHNLDSDGSCFLTSTGDLPRRDPLLGPPADNGGPSETVAPRAGSPAIDAGAAHGCPQHDQRGVARPRGAACDIGAVEYVTPQDTRARERRRRSRRRTGRAKRCARRVAGESRSSAGPGSRRTRCGHR